MSSASHQCVRKVKIFMNKYFCKGEGDSCRLSAYSSAGRAIYSAGRKLVLTRRWLIAAGRGQLSSKQSSFSRELVFGCRKRRSVIFVEKSLCEVEIDS